MAARGGKREGAGRPAGAKSRATKKHKKTLTDMAREHTGDALKVLVDIAKDEDMPPAARVSAANSILDRGYGKPAQSVEVSDPDGGPLQILIAGSDKARL